MASMISDATLGPEVAQEVDVEAAVVSGPGRAQYLLEIETH